MIIIVEGPTGSGKSALAIELAHKLNGEIVNCDSRQIYRHLDIGTAKPTKEELSLMPHHLIDIINPDQSYNAGLFVRDASSAITEIKARGKTPIICGGTGLYVRSLLEGLFSHPPIPPEVRAMLKARHKEEGIDALYAELKTIDPVFAAKISNKDSQRILRGLEIHHASGKSISQHWQEQNKTARYDAFRILINPPRETLYQRINERLSKMIEEGLIREISEVLERGYSWDAPGLSSLGYKEFRPYFESQDSLENCAQIAAQHHRNYAKRQCTWNRKIRFDLTLDSISFRLSDITGVIKPLILD